MRSLSRSSSAAWLSFCTILLPPAAAPLRPRSVGPQARSPAKGRGSERAPPGLLPLPLSAGAPSARMRRAAAPARALCQPLPPPTVVGSREPRRRARPPPRPHGSRPEEAPSPVLSVDRPPDSLVSPPLSSTGVPEQPLPLPLPPASCLSALRLRHRPAQTGPQPGSPSFPGDQPIALSLLGGKRRKGAVSSAEACGSGTYHSGLPPCSTSAALGVGPWPHPQERNLGEGGRPGSLGGRKLSNHNSKSICSAISDKFNYLRIKFFEWQIST